MPFSKPTLWIVLAALALPVGTIARAEDGPTTRPKLGGPRANDSEQGGQRRGGFGGDRGERGGPQGERGGNPFGKLIEELNLTEDQQAKVREVMKTQRDKSQANREQNKAEIDKIDAQIKELMDKKRKLMGGGPEDMVQSIRGILTPEQQKTLDAKMEEFKQHRQQGMRGGMPGADGERPQGRRGGQDGNRQRQRPNRDGNSGGSGNDSDGSMLDL